MVNWFVGNQHASGVFINFGNILLVAEFFKRIYAGLFGKQTISLFPVSLRHKETSQCGEESYQVQRCTIGKTRLGLQIYSSENYSTIYFTKK